MKRASERQHLAARHSIDWRAGGLGAVLVLAAACGADNAPITSTGGAPGTGGGGGWGGAAGMGSAGGVSRSGGATGGGVSGGGGTFASGGSGGRAGTGGAAGAGLGGAGSEGAPCEPRTQFTMATHEVLTVTWPAGPATLAGTGQVHLWGKITFTAAGTKLNGSIQACGTELPATDLNPLIGGGKILIEVPGAAWDVPAALRFAVEATQTGWSVGSAVNYTYSALVGLGEATPATGPWPTSYVDLRMPVDFDGDSRPGITGVARSGAGYQLPPASALAAVGSGGRADKLYLVDRNAGTVSLTRTSCDEAEGSETILHFDNHVVGCHIKDGAECTAAEVKFIDDNRTVYAVTGAIVKAKTISEAATCADVRRALPM